MRLDPASVRPLLRGAFGREVYLYEERCPSTQRLPPPAAPHGTVAVTEHQTEGRGRLGRVWLDRPGASVLCSTVLRPQRPVRDWPTLTPVVGEAVAAAIRALTPHEPAIKPPNDLLLGGRKVAGILAEAQEGRIVLGIGINVVEPAYEGAAALGPEVDRAELLAELLFQLERHFAVWDRSRLARDADGDRLLEIFAAARAAQGLPYPPRDSPWLRHVLSLETWLAGDGFASFGDGTLDYLYVHPDAQGEAIGGTLLGLAKGRFPDGFRLWVFQQLERSRRFYERRGLRLVEETDGSGNMERLPDALYEWRPARLRD